MGLSILLEVFSVEFSVNHPILFVMVAVLIAVVMGQSVYFLVKALRRSRRIGMDQTKIKKTIKTAAVFTIAPAVSIVISVITLSKSLGLPLPWLRLSVVGSLSYEAIAASNAVGAMGLTLGKIESLSAQQFVNVSLVMTISILLGIWLVPAIGKKLLSGMSSLENRDKKWADIFQNAMFIGMIAAFLGFVFCDFSRLWIPGEYAPTSGLIPVAVMGVSALVMVVLGLLMRKPKLSWLNVSLVMTISILLGIWLVPAIGKKLLSGMSSLENRDKKWADIFQNAMFIGMIAAFLGFVFCDFSRLWIPGEYAPTSGLIPVAVMGVSALVMVVLGLLMRKPKLSWLGDYALPISLILGMASAIPITAWLG